MYFIVLDLDRPSKSDWKRNYAGIKLAPALIWKLSLFSRKKLIRPPSADRRERALPSFAAGFRATRRREWHQARRPASRRVARRAAVVPRRRRARRRAAVGGAHRRRDGVIARAGPAPPPATRTRARVNHRTFHITILFIHTLHTEWTYRQATFKQAGIQAVTPNNTFDDAISYLP